MTNLEKTAKLEIQTLLQQALEKAQKKDKLPACEDLPAFVVEKPADVKNGDFAANAALVWARALHKAPIQIAQALCESLCSLCCSRPRLFKLYTV